MTEKYKAKKGLEGIIFDSTAVSQVLPEKKSLYYRGYPVSDLAKNCQFEEVAWLLLYGELPTKAQLDEFSQQERKSRNISDDLIEVLRRFPKNGHPMDALRTGISFLGMEEEFSGADTSESAIKKGISLMAKIPTLIAMFERIRKGEDLIPPREDLSFSENFFHICLGKVPEANVIEAFDGSLTLYACLLYTSPSPRDRG